METTRERIPAVVDLPTPPLPEATAMMSCTPSSLRLWAVPTAFPLCTAKPLKPPPPAPRFFFKKPNDPFWEKKRNGQSIYLRKKQPTKIWNSTNHVITYDARSQEIRHESMIFETRSQDPELGLLGRWEDGFCGFMVFRPM